MSLPDSSVYKLFQMRKKSDLKFSWEERQTGQHTEDWSVHKVLLNSLYDMKITNTLYSTIQIKIDGFDPDKFKAANNQNLGSKSSLRTSSISTYNNNHYNTPTTTTTTLG